MCSVSVLCMGPECSKPEIRGSRYWQACCYAPIRAAPANKAGRTVSTLPHRPLSCSVLFALIGRACLTLQLSACDHIFFLISIP